MMNINDSTSSAKTLNEKVQQLHNKFSSPIDLAETLSLVFQQQAAIEKLQSHLDLVMDTLYDVESRFVLYSLKEVGEILGMEEATFVHSLYVDGFLYPTTAAGNGLEASQKYKRFFQLYTAPSKGALQEIYVTDHGLERLKEHYTNSDNAQ